MAETTKCPVCGETSPEPSEICIPRLVKTAKPGEPCCYSREGYERFANEVGKEKAALINRMFATPPLDLSTAVEG